MMDSQEHNSCLLSMPALVLEKILANIHNPSNASRACKYLYEIVCGIEKRRRLIYISTSDGTSRLNIDDDAVFDSIMNSHRTIEEVGLRVERFENEFHSSLELQERQLERLTDIVTQFGTYITSLKLHGFVLPINCIVKLLQRAPKLESLSFTYGKVMGSLTDNTIKSLQLLRITGLELCHFPGLLNIVTLIPDGSLNYYSCSIFCTNESTVLTTILTKQHNIKSLTLEVCSNSDLTAICLDHLLLETLTFKSCLFNKDNQFVEILKGQMNLKELKFINYYNLSGGLFKWICKNLKKLEVFEVHRLHSAIEGNAFEMLGELKRLRHFRTFDVNYMFDNGLQSFQFKSDSLEIFEIGFEPEFSCGELLNKMANSMAHNLPNLTHLKMRFRNFSALCFVLGHCTKIIHLSSYISDPIPDQLTQQRFPSIQYLELHNDFYDDTSYEVMMNRSMTSIVRAMPNLKSLSLSIRCDVKTMKEFTEESKCLEYFYIDGLELNPELSTVDVVETIRCLADRLKGYHIIFSPSASPEDLNWHEIKDNLSNAFYVQHEYWKRNRNRKCFYLYKGERRFRDEYF